MRKERWAGYIAFGSHPFTRLTNIKQTLRWFNMYNYNRYIVSQWREISIINGVLIRK